MRIHSSGMARAFGILGALGAARGTRLILRRAWRTGTGEDPPDDPAAPGVTWSTALAWGVASGIVVGAARVVGHRLATVMHDVVD